MPTTYAHDLFGKRVYQRLDEETKRKIKEHQDLFQIGVHGPDILFYHEPFHKNPVSGLGSKMHQELAAEFFKEGKKRCQKEKDDALLVYLLGFICHFMLDSNCHPYINAYVESEKASHDTVETDFDRYLMEKTGKDPFSFKPGNAIHPGEQAVKTIAKVIDGVSEKELMKALKGIRFFTGVTVGNALYRKTLLAASKVIGLQDYAAGRVILAEPFENCRESTAYLAQVYEKAVPEAVQIIEDYVQTLEDTDYISDRFLRNYE